MSIGSKYGRFIGHRVRLIGGVAPPGILVSLDDTEVTIDHQVFSESIEGTPYGKSGQACGPRWLYRVEPGTVLTCRQAWLRRVANESHESLSIAVTLPRDKLEVGDTVILRTEQSQVSSTLQVEAIEISDCSHSNITAKQEGVESEVIGIEDQFVEVVLSPPRNEDES